MGGNIKGSEGEAAVACRGVGVVMERGEGGLEHVNGAVVVAGVCFSCEGLKECGTRGRQSAGVGRLRMMLEAWAARRDRSRRGVQNRLQRINY